MKSQAHTRTPALHPSSTSSPQYPRASDAPESFPGAEHCLHNSSVRSWAKLPGDDFVVIGGYESGMDVSGGGLWVLRGWLRVPNINPPLFPPPLRPRRTSQRAGSAALSSRRPHFGASPLTTLRPSLRPTPQREFAWRAPHPPRHDCSRRCACSRWSHLEKGRVAGFASGRAGDRRSRKRRTTSKPGT